MNTEKQRMTIADHLGWTSIKIYFDSNKWWGRNPKSKDLDLVPDYLNDLNAMHEALKYLKDNYTSQDFQKARFINHLENIVSSEVPNSGWSFALTTATAAQKAEAFLKTIGKWEE